MLDSKHKLFLFIITSMVITSYVYFTLLNHYSIEIFTELREAFEAEAQEKKMPRLLLTAAVPVGPDNVKSGYDVPAVAR